MRKIVFVGLMVAASAAVGGCEAGLDGEAARCRTNSDCAAGARCVDERCRHRIESADASAPRVDAGDVHTTPEGSCNDGTDEDGDGAIDEGCSCRPGEAQGCYPGDPAEIGRGPCRRGTQVCEGSDEFGAWADCVDPVLPADDSCGDRVDDDCNGYPDDGPDCVCDPEESRPCYDGPPSTRGVGVCADGRQQCSGVPGVGWGECVDDVLPRPEICGNGLDDDCNGMVDEGCPTIVVLDVALDGDCVTAQCPPEAPHPIACHISMAGADPRGCVASAPTNPVVYFQEGNDCGLGRVRGTLTCSSEPGPPLSAANCPIDKPTAYYPASSAGCP